MYNIYVRGAFVAHINYRYRYYQTLLNFIFIIKHFGKLLCNVLFDRKCYIRNELVLSENSLLHYVLNIKLYQKNVLFINKTIICLRITAVCIYTPNFKIRGIFV